MLKGASINIFLSIIDQMFTLDVKGVALRDNRTDS